MEKLEFRHNCEIRAVDNNDGKMVIEGVVNKVGEWSKILFGSFREKVEPGVFKAAIESAKKNNRDIFFLALHNNRSLPLASILSGTMALEEKEGALRLRAELPPTTMAKDIYELVKARVLREFSFGFNNVVARWDKDADGVRTRTITSLNLFEVSVVTTGAYNNTEINARSLTMTEILPEEIRAEIEKEQKKDNKKTDNEKEDDTKSNETEEKKKAEKRALQEYEYNKNKLRLLELE